MDVEGFCFWDDCLLAGCGVLGGGCAGSVSGGAVLSFLELLLNFARNPLTGYDGYYLL